MLSGKRLCACREFKITTTFHSLSHESGIAADPALEPRFARHVPRRDRGHPAGSAPSVLLGQSSASAGGPLNSQATYDLLGTVASVLGEVLTGGRAAVPPERVLGGELAVLCLSAGVYVHLAGWVEGVMCTGCVWRSKCLGVLLMVNGNEVMMDGIFTCV